MKNKMIAIFVGIILALGTVFTPLVSANPAANLDQIRNGPADDPWEPAEWVNGNAGGQNAHYLEGYSIAYRCIMTDLPTGVPITITFGYTIKHDGKHALDYLTNYSRIDDPSHDEVFGHSAETIDPLFGTTSVNLTQSYFVIPAPSSVGSPVPGQPTKSYNDLIAAEGIGQAKMACFGGTISNISYIALGDLNAVKSNASVNVTFIASGTTVVLAWGGHIASRADWGYDVSGEPLSAGGISGSPYHMYLVGWTIDNLGQQDRSLKTDAIIPPSGKIIVCKHTTPDSDTTTEFTFTTDYDIPFVLTNGQCNESIELYPGSYTITEGFLAGWDLTDIQITDPSGGSGFDIANRTVEVNLSADDIVYVNFTNAQRGCLQVTKIVDWNGASPVVGQTFDICLTGPSYPSGDHKNFTYPDNLTYTWYNLIPGNYTLTEQGVEAEWSVLINGSNTTTFELVISSDGGTTYTDVTNIKRRGSLSITKVLNWNGVIPIPDVSFEVNISGPSYPHGHLLSFTGNGTQVLADLIVGWYWVNETNPGSMWNTTPGLSQKVYVGPNSGSGAAVTITNNYDAGCLRVVKELWWNGAAPTDQEFTITVEGPQGYQSSFPVSSDGQEVILNNLRIGTYWVNETDPGDDWIITPGFSQQVVVQSSTYADGACALVTINNTHVPRPGVTIEKTADRDVIYPGEDITYSYLVTNTGNIRVQITSLVDDLLGDLLNDPSVVFSGDTNEDGWLDTNETWVFSKTQYWNLTDALFTLDIPTEPVTLNVVNGTVSYYDLTLSGVPDGYDVTNGQYLSWCIDRDVIMPRGVDHLVSLYSSYDPQLPPTVQHENWSKVNYLLNHKNGYDKTDIQDAIWYFINHVPTGNPDALTLIQDANDNGAGFEPQVGEVIAIIAVGSRLIQDTIFELMLPEYPVTNNVSIEAMNPFDGGSNDTDSLTVWVRAIAS